MVKLAFANEQEWHALRATHIGGSEIAALFDVQPDYMPGEWALWQYKTGFADPPVLDSNLVKWGSRLEKPIAEGIAEDNGWEICKGGYYQDDICPHLGASLDYEIISGHENDGNGCLEIKNVNTFNFSKTWTDGEPPIHILLQLQHQLAATGCKWGVIAALRGGCEPFVFHYQRDEELISHIRNNITSFWQKVENLEQPEMDHSPANKELLKQFYPDLQDEIADLSDDNEIETLCVQFKTINEQRKQLEKKEDTLKFSIMQKVKDYKKVVVTGFRIGISQSEDTLDRLALPGEIIKGRAGCRRLTVKAIEV